MDHTALFESEFQKLNPQQTQAVESLYGPIMVVAGPGTGKTQIIGMRTANIILKAGINPENILITTFTEAGVIAIRERLLRFLGNDAYKVNVSTIHSLAQDIIKTFPEKFLEYKAGSPIDEVESLEILKGIIDKLSEKKQLEQLTTDYDRYFYLRDIKSRISTLKGEGVSINKFEKLINKQEETYKEELGEIKPTLKKYETTKEKQEKHIAKLRELVILFKEYNATLRANSQYDFNDMINFVLEKFMQDDELKHYYAEIFQFIMLDEYQDTNNAQNLIIDMILSVSHEQPNIMVVGDDDQSIYRFQGANIENMLDFSTKYPETQFIVLEHNYRSTQQILDLSSQLIGNNEERLSKKIKTINKKLTASGALSSSHVLPQLLRAPSDLEEKSFIVNSIQQKLEQGEQADQIAIIVRGNKEVEEWTRLLQQNNIEAESKLKTDILKSNYVELILKYLRLINDPYRDEINLIDIMRTQVVGLNQIDILKINRYLYTQNYSRKRKLQLFDILTNEEKIKELDLADTQCLLDFRNNLLYLGSQLSEKSFVEFFNEFIEKTGILEFIEKNGNFDDIEDIYTLFNQIKQWNIADKELNIETLFAKIELYKNYNYPIARQILKKTHKGVQVLTAHGAKGLEYNNVYIPGLYTGNWEGKRVIDRLKLPDGVAGEGLQSSNFKQIEEDRRLFFVAITRAKEHLYLSYPAGIGTKPLLQSSFIEEIIGNVQEINIDGYNGQVEEVVKNELKGSLIKYSDLEFDYIKEFLETYRLSPSDLNVFLESPIDFLNRVIFKYPFMDNKFTIFGKVYHRTLELFFLKYKKDSLLPEKSYLTSTFKLLLEKEILTPEEFEELNLKGITGLEGYYDLYSSSIKIPLALEYSLRRKNIVFEGVPLTGTIDKIEKTGHTSSQIDNKEGQLAFFRESVALIDYKTGSVKTLGTIKGVDRYGNKKEGEGKYFRQLMFYKLLCEQDYEFHSKFEVGSLALDFVEGKNGKYKYVEVDCSDEEFNDFKSELVEARGKITDIDYWRELLKK